MHSPFFSFICIVFFSTVVAFHAWAQDAKPQKPLENALLWQVTGKGIKKPSYLYGTIHAICEDDMIITQKLKDRFASTEQLYLELDLDDPKAMIATQMSALMTDGNTLKTLMKPADFERLSAFCKDSMDLDINQFLMFKPFFVSSLFMTKALECEGKKPKSYEEKFMSMAKMREMEILGLESVEDQLNAVNGIPLDKQVEMLLESMNTYKEGLLKFQELVNAYKTQNLATFSEMMKDPNSGANLGDNQAAFLDDRNTKWIPIIAKAAKKKPTFFAFGAAHLVGDMGVIQLLRKAGYTVEAVR